MSTKRGQEHTVRRLILSSGVARGAGGRAVAPPLACQPKCKIKKYHIFSTFETVFRTEIDQKVI